MAMRVPTIDLPQGQLGDLRLPTGMGEGIESTAAAGSYLGQTEEEAGKKAEGAALKAQGEANHTEATSRMSDLNSWRANTIDSKLLQTKGSQALGIADQGMSAYDEQVTKLDSTLENDDQRRMFHQQVFEDRPLVDRQLRVHEVQQLEIQGETDFRTTLDHDVSDAGLMWKLPGGPEAKIAMGERDIAERAKRKGWSDEQTLNELRDFRSRIVASVVGGATVDPSDMGGDFARKFLERYSTLSIDAQGNAVPDTRGLIDGSTAHKLGALVKSAGVRDTVKREVMRIESEVPPDPVTGVADIEKQLRVAGDTIQNGEVWAHVREDLHTDWNIAKANRAEQNKVKGSDLIASISEQESANALIPRSALMSDPRYAALDREGQAAVMAQYVAAQDHMRVRATAADEAVSRRRRMVSDSGLDEYVKYITSLPDDKVMKIDRLTVASLINKVTPGMDWEGMENAQRFTLMAQKFSQEKFLYKINSYVEDTLGRKYPNDLNSRTQLRGALRRMLMQGLEDGTVKRTDKDMRDFLRSSVNGTVPGTGIFGSSFGGQSPVEASEQSLDQAAQDEAYGGGQ